MRWEVEPLAAKSRAMTAGLAALTLVWLGGPFVLTPLLLSQSYPRWFVANGALLAILTAAATSLMPTKGDIDLVAANPIVFLGTNLQYLGSNLYGVGTALKSGPGRGLAIYVGGLLSAFIVGVALLFLLLFALPGLYFVRLITGALPRRFAGSDVVGVVTWEGTQVRMGDKSRADVVPEDLVLDPARRPVAFADSLGAVVLFFAAQYLL